MNTDNFRLIHQNVLSVGIMYPKNFISRCKEMENERVEEDVIAAFRLLG